MIGVGGNGTRVLSTPGKNFENCVFNDGRNVCGIDIFDGTDMCVIASKNFPVFVIVLTVLLEYGDQKGWHI